MKLIQLVAIILIISCVNAQVRRKPSRPARPAKQIRARQYQDWDPNQMCWDDPDLWRFADYECDQYWECDDAGNANLFICDFGLIFDFEWLDCYSREEDQAMCWSDEEDNGECPTNSNEVVFLPGDTCEDYFICINGQPVQFWCRQGQHWNMEQQYCDNPRSAGCNATATDVPELPDCMRNVEETLPHPTHCHWFVFCQKNGNRLIQQCPHLYNYDVNSNTCVIHTKATCYNGATNPGIFALSRGK